MYGKMYLTNSVNEAVRQLYYDGEIQNAGTYGSTASAATYKDDNRFAGTGILTVQGGNSAWITDGSGNWNTADNWQGGVIPSDDSYIAYFTNTISADVTVNQDLEPLGIGGLVFGSPANNWVITNTAITLTNSLNGVPSITVDRNIATIGAAVDGRQGFTKAGTGELILANTNNLGPLNVNAGTLSFTVTDTPTSNVISTATVNGGSAGATLNVSGLTRMTELKAGSVAGSRSVVTITTNLYSTRYGLGKGVGGASAAIYQTGGIVTQYIAAPSTYDFTIGDYSNSFGYYQMAGGDLNVSGVIYIGGANNNASPYGGSGVFDMSGGNVTVNWLVPVRNANSQNGVLNISGGTMSLTGANDMQCLRGGANNRAAINIMGTGVLDTSASSRSVDLMNASGNHICVLNLVDGGLLIANRILATAAGTTVFNFNGGMLRANPAGVGTYGPTFLQGLSSSTIYANGAFIDSGTNAITIGQALQAPVGYGVSSITLGDKGAGYIGTPIVRITGGSGTGATAIAQVDLNSVSPTFGQVTNILITSPGYAYSTPPTITLIGGGYITPATIITSTVGSFTGGGLTKLGAGKLNLNANNTYSGNTVISSGVLALITGGSLSATPSVTIQAGATLAITNANNTLNTEATVYVDATGTITLAGGGITTVRKLYIAGAPAASEIGRASCRERV